MENKLIDLFINEQLIEKDIVDQLLTYLKDNNYKDAFGDLHEYLVDQSYCYPSTSDFDTLEEARLVQDYNQVYANKGIVCMEDKDNILELIHLFRYYLKIN